jgi:hypothetical protein
MINEFINEGGCDCGDCSECNKEEKAEEKTEEETEEEKEDTGQE